MASTLLWVFRFLHILSAVAWIGGAFVWGMVIAPRLLAKGPMLIRRPVLEALVVPLPRFFHSAGIATLVFGVLLLGDMYGWSQFASTLQAGSYGAALGAGIVLAVIMVTTGFVVIEPTIKKLLATVQSIPAPSPGSPPSPPPVAVQAQLASLGKRMRMAGMAQVLMGTLALIAMTWAVSTHIGI